jgi:HIV Tat-specific factor 1
MREVVSRVVLEAAHTEMTTEAGAAAPSPPGTGDYCYYLSKSGETRGPTMLVALDALRRVGEVSDETLIWKPDLAAWLPYKSAFTSQPASLDGPAAVPEAKGARPPPPAAAAGKPKPSEPSSAVFVQGLPSSATAEQVAAYFSKCGILKKDPSSHQDRVKLYEDEATGQRTGEALVIFLQPPSVDLAVELLDQVEFAPGHTLAVSVAKFEPKPGGEREAARPKKQRKPAQPDTQPKADKRVKQVLKMQEQLALSWSDGDGPVKEAALCIVVLKNMFDPQTLANGGDAALGELRADIDEGLEMVDGEVRKVTVFKRHPEGVVLVRFTDPVHAEECVRVMRGRWFDGRRIDAQLWDGVTMYGATDHDEKDREEEARMDQFGDVGLGCAGALEDSRPAARTLRHLCSGWSGPCLECRAVGGSRARIVPC